MAGAREPGLQQRAVGRQREERQTDRGGEQAEQPEGFTCSRRPPQPTAIAERQREGRDDHHHEMDDDRRSGPADSCVSTWA